MTGLRRVMVLLVALPVLAGCSVSETPTASGGALNCMDSVPRSGDLNDRTRMAPVSCPAQSGKGVDPVQQGPSVQAASAPSAAPSAVSSGSGSAGPTPAASRPAVPAASLRVGQRSPAGGGSYVMWIKAENHVYLVSRGKVIRVMPTTALTWKTPPGTYEVTYKERNSASLDKGHTWVLPYFVAFWRRPGANGDIAFHQVPHDARNHLAQPLDTVGEDGQVSDGCARMRPADAKAIWDFTKVGSRVVVR